MFHGRIINNLFSMEGSVFHGSESISCLGFKIWDIVLLELTKLTSVVAFKKGIKEWMPKKLSM